LEISFTKKWQPTDKDLATRQASEAVLNKITETIPEILGGSADLTPSTLTLFKSSNGDFQKGHYIGRYFRFGIREHGMSAALNGLAAYNGLIPFGATFLNFIGYALGAVRLSAISHVRVLYVMTHDSIGLGEDGPTHQPIESLAIIRAMPNILLIRPADGNETSGAYAVALENLHRPSVLCFTRQPIPQLPNTSIEGVTKGAYVIQDCPNPKIILTASGSEVHLAIGAAKQLNDVRVVSFPCFELFEEQSIEYKRSVFLPGIPVLSIEAAAPFGWEKYSHACIGMTTFGASGPVKDVLAHFGYTVDNIINKTKKLLDYYSKNSVPTLLQNPLL